MSRDTSADIATLLEASGLTLARPPASGANLFLGQLPELGAGLASGATVPAKAVAVRQSGERLAEPYLGQGRKNHKIATCTLMVRSDREDYQSGQTLASAVFDAIHLANPSPYLSMRVREGAPNHLGTDGNDCHLWSLNVEAEYIDAGTSAPPISLTDPGDRRVTGDLIVDGRLGLGQFPTATLPSSARAGALVWDSTTGQVKFANGTAWAPMVDTATSAALSAHIAATAAHGVTGAVVGTTDAQTLTNKVLDRLRMNDGNGEVQIYASYGSIGTGQQFTANLLESNSYLNVGTFFANYARIEGTNVAGQGVRIRGISNGANCDINVEPQGAGLVNLKGPLTLPAGDSTATPGAATINKPVGKSKVAAGASSVVVTNSVVVGATSLVRAWIQQAAADATAKNVARTSVVDGALTIYLDSACTAAVTVGWEVLN